MKTEHAPNPSSSHEELEQAADHHTAETQLQNLQWGRFDQLSSTDIGNFREAIAELTTISPNDPNYAEALHTLQELRAALTSHIHGVEPDQIFTAIERELDQVEIEAEHLEERREDFAQFMLELGSPVLLRNVSIAGLGLRDYEFEGFWSFEEVASQDSQGNVSGIAAFTGTIHYPDGGEPTHCVNLPLEIENAKIALGKMAKTSAA